MTDQYQPGEPQLELVSDGGHTPVTIDFASFFADHQRPIASALATRVVAGVGVGDLRSGSCARGGPVEDPNHRNARH